MEANQTCGFILKYDPFILGHLADAFVQSNLQ